MVSRRDFLKTTTGLATGLAAGLLLPKELLAGSRPVYAGWKPNKRATAKFKSQNKVHYFAQAGRQLAGSGEGKVAPLWKFMETATGTPIAPHDQAIGDCFAAGTMVQTSMSVVPIEDIQVGDQVFTGLGTLTDVVSTRELTPRSGMVRVDVTGGEAIEVTEDHQFLVYRTCWVAGKRVNKAFYERCVNGSSNQAVCQVYETRQPEWIQAGDLRDTDYLLTPKSDLSQVPNLFQDPDWLFLSFYCRPVKGVTSIEAPSKVYDIGVADAHHSFIANGVAVHNCVSHGWGLGIDILDAVQASQGNGEWQAKCATEVIYAGSRVEVGKGVVNGDGSTGSWAAQWCREGGVLLRRPYLDGKYDFTNYSGAKARDWAHNCEKCTTWGGGVPDDLEVISKRHPVRTTTLVRTWEEARDSVYNGYPVVICSDQGFKDTRDRDGFAKAKDTWYHCMLLAGIDDSGKRSGGLLLNSWGPDWNSGPTRLGQPPGSFWVDARILEKMLAWDDSYALSNYLGYPSQNLDYKLY